MVGNILKAAREKQGLTVKDIENETSIRSSYIDAIEKGDYDSLPNEVYVKGFIRNYAEFLELPADRLVEQFREELHGFDSEAPEEEEKSVQSHSMFDTGTDFHERVENSHRTQNILITIGIIVLAFVGGIYYFFGEDPHAKPAPKQPTQQTAQETKKTPPAAQPPKESAAVPKNGAGAVEPNVAKTAPSAATPGISVPSKNGMIELSAKFSDRCWTWVEADGKTVFEGTVEPNKTMSWSGKQSIRVTVGNAGAADITYNGKNIGKLGKSGEVVERRFTKDKMEKVK